MKETNPHAAWLRELASHMRADHNWSHANTCEGAAREIDALAKHRDDLLAAHERAGHEPPCEHPQALQDVVDFWQDAANGMTNRDEAGVVSHVLHDVRKAVLPPSALQALVSTIRDTCNEETGSTRYRGLAQTILDEIAAYERISETKVHTQPPGTVPIEDLQACADQNVAYEKVLKEIRSRLRCDPRHHPDAVSAIQDAYHMANKALSPRLTKCGDA